MSKTIQPCCGDLPRESSHLHALITSLHRRFL